LVDVFINQWLYWWVSDPHLSILTEILNYYIYFSLFLYYTISILIIYYLIIIIVIVGFFFGFLNIKGVKIYAIPYIFATTLLLYKLDTLLLKQKNLPVLDIMGFFFRMSTRRSNCVFSYTVLLKKDTQRF
jgi:amino acid transporter